MYLQIVEYHYNMPIMCSRINSVYTYIKYYMYVLPDPSSLVHGDLVKHARISVAKVSSRRSTHVLGCVGTAISLGAKAVSVFPFQPQIRISRSCL